MYYLKKLNKILKTLHPSCFAAHKIMIKEFALTKLNVLLSTFECF